ncbi:hypothetical protein SI65_07064 [Aspergillus cristatus]|uniref:Uncharacterized protein n=1 Tax=Aspergillus cristatus TaxID=573508 RepID=A0A1E3B8Y9_ASPCR|nr:hypothetical protein SI65_07064 [Aspergillus cristatus]
MHLLSETTIATILTSLMPSQGQEFLNILIQSLSSLNTNDAIHQPARTSIVTDQSTALFMPVSNTTTTGIKIVHVPRTRPIAGVINLFDPKNGHLLGILGAAEITAFRTALATMTLFVRATGDQTGIKRENIVVFGSGRQAEWHARLALLLSPPGSVQSITFVNRGRARLQTLEEVFPVLRGEYPGVTMDTLSQETLSQDDYEARLKGLLGGSDVIFSCTPATEPNFPFAYLQQHPKRRFLGLIGSYKPQMQEIDTETLLSGGGKIYVDSKEACLEESGELIRAGVTEDQLVEIGEVYGGSSAVQIDANNNVVFKCVGMGLMDLVIAKQVLEVAIKQGQGMNVEGFA